MDANLHSDEEIVFLAALVEAVDDEERNKRKRKVWVHEINSKRLNFGEHHHLFPDLLKDSRKFLKYFRTSQEKFYKLLDLIRPDIEKQDTTFRQAIPSEERLATCLRFLATGDTFGTIAFSYRLGEKSVRRIVYETCDAIGIDCRQFIWLLQQKRNGSKQQFRVKWNFPNCIGAIDGKHVVINKPYHSGSLYFNYKGFCSLVLMAVADAHCRFIMIDAGGYGKNSDGSTFSNCNFGRKFRDGKLDFPEDMPLPGTQEHMPYVFVGDEAFPLHRHLMRPYPGAELVTNEGKTIFNLRLSRARNTSEDSFGILSKRFHVYQRRLEMKPKYATKVILATCCLHNFLTSDCPVLLAEVIQNEEPVSNPCNSALQNLKNVGGTFSGSAYIVREKFENYFLSPNGLVEWQVRTVQQGRRYN